MTIGDPRTHAVERYVAWWQGLGAHGGAGAERIFAPEGRFRDPFVELVGPDAIGTHMAATARRVENLAVVVTDIAYGRSVYIRWRFGWRLKDRDWVVEGVSEIDFDDEGFVVAHIDHWDAAGQIYGRVPGLGWLMRLLARRAAG